MSATLLSTAQLQERVLVCCVMMGRIITQTQYSPTPVIRTSVIRNLDYPNGVPNVESV